MRTYLTLTRRELGAYFVSVTGYIIIAAMTLLLGGSFLLLIVNWGNENFPMPLTELFYQTMFFWIIVLPAAPVITMRLFALERFSGTYETLMTTPVTEFQVVAAKFTAAQLFYFIAWLPLLACIFILDHYSAGGSGFDAGAIGVTFLGINLMGAVFLSIGCLASAVTRSQAVAAILGLAGALLLFFLSFLPQQLSAVGWQLKVIECFALRDQMHDFTRGVLDTRPVVVYLTLTLFFLFLTLRVEESRRWK